MGKFSRRVQDYLWWAERHEPDVWLAEDYRQAWITVYLAERGCPCPFVTASYRMYGLHPDKLWPAIVARRKALLGPLYEAFWGADAPRKKPPRSARLPVGVQIERSFGLEKQTARIVPAPPRTLDQTRQGHGLTGDSISQFKRRAK